MFIIEKQGMQEKELLAQITAYYATKALNINTKNVVLEFTDLGHENWGVVSSPDDLHFIEVNKDNGVTKVIQTVCHELRHVWQAQNGWEFDYTLPYMEQPHEVDAWKFMDDFVAEYKDAIYSEYLDKKQCLDTDISDWENYIIPPPEYLDMDLSEMVGLSYTSNNEMERTTMKKSIKKVINKMKAKKSIDTATEVGVPEEQIIHDEAELEAFINETEDAVKENIDAAHVIDLGLTQPAADESPVAEKTNKEKDEEIMTEVKVITLEEHNAAIEFFKENLTKLQDAYEETIARLTEDNEGIRAELADAVRTLNETNSLRKADAKRIEKLENEMGRARLQLREHKVRQLSEDKVFELPEQEVTAVVKARINTATKIDNVALAIHGASPEKIAVAAEKTKDGVQWIADKTKDGIDLTAKGTNVVTEVLANSMIYVADKIAPTDETVVKSIAKKDGDITTVNIRGTEYRVDQDGKLIY